MVNEYFVLQNISIIIITKVKTIRLKKTFVFQKFGQITVFCSSSVPSVSHVCLRVGSCPWPQCKTVLKLKSLFRHRHYLKCLCLKEFESFNHNHIEVLVYVTMLPWWAVRGTFWDVWILWGFTWGRAVSLGWLGDVDWAICWYAGGGDLGSWGADGFGSDRKPCLASIFIKASFVMKCTNITRSI